MTAIASSSSRLRHTTTIPIIISIEKDPRVFRPNVKEGVLGLKSCSKLLNSLQ